MVTKELSDFLYDVKYEDLCEKAVDCAKMCVEDLMGVALAGSLRPQGKIWRAYFAQQPNRAEATVWDGRLGSGLCENAAALNAAYAHVLDMDDVHNSSITHLGAVTIPTALAVGQKHRRSGGEVLAAIVAGYEIGARIGEAINPGAYHYWHTTAVIGGFSSAVAAGKLMGLTRDQLLHAIGSAGTQAAGLWQFIEDGAMSKTLHTANATLCGIRSAELAGLGFTAAQDILGGERGFLGAMTPDNRPELLVEGLGSQPWKITTNSFKPYACCRHAHSANYCAELLKKEQGLGVEEIVSITDYTYQVAKDNVDTPAPATPYGFKFSVQYCLAALLLFGNLNEESFSAEKTHDPAARRLMDKIKVVVDPALEAMYRADPNRWPHRLEVELADGTKLVRQVEVPFGDFNNPFSWEDTQGKFFDLSREVLAESRAEALARRISRLEELEDINDLFQQACVAAV